MIVKFKNGKLYTFNISCIKIILSISSFLLFPLIMLPADQEKQWVIVIDPGHGGKDPGAIGSFSKEEDINLAIALKTGAYIEQNLKNVKIVYTRKEDKSVDLYDRPRIANENNADLFISIHTNQASAKSATGAETFIMGHTKDKENLAIAMKENEVMQLEDDYSVKYKGFDPKSPESSIMFMVMQNVYQKQSLNLADKIQTELRERVSRNDRSVKQAGFWVLFNTTMPSVLIETGFISNPAEEKFLNSEQGQNHLASAIFRACKDYIDEINSRSIAITDIKKDTTLTASLDNIITEPEELPVFTVQISSSTVKKEISPANFKGVKDVRELNLRGNFKYVTGNFSDYSDAVKYRKELIHKFPDAFIIALKNNEPVPLQEALKQLKK
ncbi:MAG TPA: N-acetylmuramoyl-L-alanine amidase [Bacteroidales bacterium]|nr:N-acetylmuramoyl-L-alanine amidase [Bacteroidales bacterium]